MTSACSHQLTRPASDASSSRHVSRNVTISVAMNRPMTIDSIDTRAPSADRTHERTSRQQEQDAGEHGDRKRRENRPVGREPAAPGDVGDAEARQELHRRVAAERDEAPEHECVREAGDRPLRDRPALADDVGEEAQSAHSGAVDRERVGCGGNQPDPRRDLRRKRAGEHEDEQPEHQRLHHGRLYRAASWRVGELVGW